MTGRLVTIDDRWAMMGIVVLAVALLANLPFASLLSVSIPPTLSTQATSPEDLPAGLETAISTTLGKAYLITQGVEGVLEARNAGQDLEAIFSAGRFGVRPLNGVWSFDLSMARFGRQDQLVPVAISQPLAIGARVEYPRAAFTEWYENQPHGIEHGVTLLSPPPGGGMLQFEFTRSEILAAVLSPDARAIALFDSYGAEVLRYQDLIVYDAAGNELPAVIELGAGTLSLLVDDRDAAYPITIDPLVVTEEAHLFASDAAANDIFGGSVALSGDTALVGAPFDDTPAGVNAGSAYVFVRQGTTWTEQAHLFASDAAERDLFGYQVALDGTTAFVGAIGDDTDDDEDAGSVYVFNANGNTWTEQAHLFASDGGTSDLFGSSLALEGDTALVGAPFDDTDAGEDAGSAYVFIRQGSTWTEQAHLFASDAADLEFFGASVALEGGTALVGAMGDTTTAGLDVGSVYVFSRSRNTWTEQAHLFASDGAQADFFGAEVALEGSTALVGAVGDDTSGGEDAGSVYIFIHNGTTWTEQAHLFASDGAAGDGFGASVALQGDTAVVGAHGVGTSAGADTGSVYLFTRDGASWTQEGQFFASDGASGDFFGGAGIALEGNTALVGAESDDTAAGVNAGSVYVFAISDASACSITGTEDNDVLFGTEGDDVICGLGGNDRLSGLGGNDILLGGDGNDILDGGTGTNILDGGQGIDTVTYTRAASAVTANLATGTASGPSTDSLVSIENMVGSNFDDRLTGDSGDNVLNGSRGIDRLNGGPGSDTCISGELVIACEIARRRQAF